MNKATRATIEITGIGINRELAEIFLVGALTMAGEGELQNQEGYPQPEGDRAGKAG
jgi:hypothetical protein